MGTEEFLREAVTILAVAVGVVVVSARLRVPPVVGFLLSGMVIGPTGLALVPETGQVEIFAEIGVVLLLFTVGMQIDLSEMKGLGRSFLVGGSLQWVLTTGLTLWIVHSLGVPLANALFIGFVVSLSSTVVVLREYQERRETTTPQGRVVLGVLLFQDLLIVPMIAVTPILAGAIDASPSGLLARFGGAVLAVGLVFIVGRAMMPRIAKVIVGTRIRELLILATLTLCLAMAWFTAHLHFSLALGAFLAGLLIAETEYSHQVIADVGPFRDLFASIFFVSIGMLVDLPFAIANLPQLAGLTLLLIFAKAVTTVAALKLAGFTNRIAVVCGVGLSQIGEFSFVLMEVGRDYGLLQGGRFQTLLVAAVLTVALTPLLVRIAPALGHRAAALGGERSVDDRHREREDLSEHVVVVGYGMSGRLLARVLGEARIPFLIIELDPDTVRAARRAGTPVLYGDAAQRQILEQAGVGKAKMVVFQISDFATVVRSLRTVRELAPRVEILIRTRRFTEIDALRQAGAQRVVAEEFESAIEIFTSVLSAYHVPRNVIRAETRVLRGESYKMLRSAPPEPISEAVLEALVAGTIDTFRVSARSRAAGRSLRDLDLRRRIGASVIAAVRGEQSFPNPPPDLILESGDYLVLMGSHEEIDRAFVFLDEAISGDT